MKIFLGFFITMIMAIGASAQENIVVLEKGVYIFKQQKQQERVVFSKGKTYHFAEKKIFNTKSVEIYNFDGELVASSKDLKDIHKFSYKCESTGIYTIKYIPINES